MEFNKDILKGRLTRTAKKEVQSNKKKILSTRKVGVEITDDTLRGVVISYKNGQLDIYDSFALDKKNTVGVNKSFLADEAISKVIEHLLINNVSKNKAAFTFTSLGGNDKVVKYPPLDKKTLTELIKQSYMQFFADKESSSTKGTELLGDMDIPKGELYYLLSTINKNNILDISLQLERKKVRIEHIYNEVLALRNIMNIIYPNNQTKCMLYIKGTKVYVLLTRNNTLIFHKSLESSKPKPKDGNLADMLPRSSNLTSRSKDNEEDIVSDYDNPEKHQEKTHEILTTVIPNVLSTLDYLRINENYNFDELLIAGDIVKLPNIDTILTEELMLDTRILDLSAEGVTDFDIVNWTVNNITADYLVALGTALKGVIK